MSLLAPERAEWGAAMLGELGHLEGWFRRMRFAIGCVGAALVLPPWGRAAAGFWAVTGLTAGALAVYVTLTAYYRLDVADWVALTVLAVICFGLLLGASALIRRTGIALPGLLGGVALAVSALAAYGFTFVNLVSNVPDRRWQWLEGIAVPLLVGIAGTLWRRDAAAGRRIARLAALSGGLFRLAYATLAVAVVRGGGPPDADGGFTLRGTIGDRLGNNIFELVVLTLMTAMVGWAGSGLGSLFLRRRSLRSSTASSLVEGQNP